MKKSLITLYVISSFFTANVMAADIEASVVKRNVENIENPVFADFLYINPLDMSEIELPTKSLATSNVITPRSPAKGITYFEIGQVGSSSVGWETISQHQSSTNSNHGGQELYTYVWQVGYGNVNRATMNGVSKTPLVSEPRCGSNLNKCRPGDIATGYRYLFYFSGQESGKFTVSANSIASPFGYWSDSIYIN